MIDSWLFLLGLAIFPRITLLVSSVLTGGILWWLGWLFTPHVLVAILATNSYWVTNPILVMLSWVFAIIGVKVEYSVFLKRKKPLYGTIGRR